jgi:hypothetical protein
VPRRWACAVPLLLIFLPAHASGQRAATVRPPTSKEHALIVATVGATWWYESTPDAAGYSLRFRRRHFRRPALKPAVVGSRVSRRDPRYASALVELRDRQGRPRTPRAVVVLKKSSAYGRHRWGYAVAGPALSFTNSCGRRTLQALRDLMCPDPWSVLGAKRPLVRGQTHFAQQIDSPNLHALDWKHVALPGGACGSSRPIGPWRRAGSGVAAFIHPDVNLLWWNPVWVYSWEKPIFGDVDGDGRDEAALSVVCANGGGTADGQLAFSVVVFKAVGNSLHVVGIVRPRQPLTPEIGHVPLVTTVKIEHGRVVAPETWYGPHDGTCCGSGRARTTWAYRGGRLYPLRTEIVRKPWLSPLQPEVLGGQPLHDLDGKRLNPLVARPGLAFAVIMDNVSLGHVTKRNVKVTLRILGGSTRLARTKTVAKIRPWSHHPPTVRFDHLGSLPLNRRLTVEVDIADPGASPLRFPVMLRRS